MKRDRQPGKDDENQCEKGYQQRLSTLQPESRLDAPKVVQKQDAEQKQERSGSDHILPRLGRLPHPQRRQRFEIQLGHDVAGPKNRLVALDCRRDRLHLFARELAALFGAFSIVETVGDDQVFDQRADHRRFFVGEIQADPGGDSAAFVGQVVFANLLAHGAFQDARHLSGDSLPGGIRQRHRAADHLGRQIYRRYGLDLSRLGCQIGVAVGSHRADELHYAVRQRELLASDARLWRVKDFGDGLCGQIAPLFGQTLADVGHLARRDHVSRGHIAHSKLDLSGQRQAHHQGEQAEHAHNEPDRQDAHPRRPRDLLRRHMAAQTWGLRCAGFGGRTCHRASTGQPTVETIG